MIWADRSEGVYFIGWLASVCLHATLAIGAFVLTQRMSLAPNPAPFTWNVALLSAPSEPMEASASKAQAVPAPSMKNPSSVHLPPLRRAAKKEGIPAAMTVEPPSLAPEKPMVYTNEASLVPDSHERFKSNVQQQTVEQVITPKEPTPTPTTPLFSNQEQHAASESASIPPSEELESAAVREIAGPAPTSPKPDYAWLSETILRRMHELKRYPAEARLDRAEGKVVLKAVIQSNGSIEAVEVFQTSGHESLDRAALELLTKAAPFRFPRPLGRPQMTVKIPMNYRLEAD